MTMQSDLPSCWAQALKDTLNSKEFKNLEVFLEKEYNSKKIFPVKENIFAALKAAPLDQVKVVIIGQDPYHGAGQAHGLSFSVLPGTPIPPSLRNIYKELSQDVNMDLPEHGYLMSWAKQGVLLLNNVLTVEEGKPGSHQKRGWEFFTDAVIGILAKRENIVFLLWGAPAQKKAKSVSAEKHLILTAPHPSPLSSYRGFFGCKHFSKTNAYLKSKGIQEIHWNKLNR